MRIILKTLAVATVSLLGAGACSDGGDTAENGTVDVVASFYPLADAARRVAGDRGDVRNLTPVGSEPHDFEPSPRHIDQVEDADLVFYLGTAFQPAVAELAEGAGDKAVDLLRGLRVESDDPHVWLDPELMGGIVEQIAAELSRVDPEGRDLYAENAARYREDLGRLAAEFDTGLANCERNIMVVPHASFEYLAARHQLEQEPIAGSAPESEPDPARLARLVELVRDGGITTIFVDPLEPDEAAETLARQTNSKTAVLYTIEGLTEAESERGEDYFSLMRRNLQTLREALTCP